MRTRIIAFANHKGGVGKTTTTATLGSIISRVGIRTLLVDLDAQCNLTDTFISDIPEFTVYEMFKDRRPYEPINVAENLDLIPANLDMSALDMMLGSQYEKERILADVFSQMKIEDKYDIVLLDCPPSLGVVTVNALVAATDIYVPIAPEFYPVKGLMKLEEVCTMVGQRLNPGVGINGVIVTKYNPSKKLFVEVDKKLRDTYGERVFRTRIRENVKLAEAPMQKKDIVSYAPGSNGAVDYTNLAKEILTRLSKER